MRSPYRDTIRRHSRARKASFLRRLWACIRGITKKWDQRASDHRYIEIIRDPVTRCKIRRRADSYGPDRVEFLETVAFNAQRPPNTMPRALPPTRVYK